MPKRSKRDRDLARLSEAISLNQLDQALLDSIPQTAMIISKNRVVLAANEEARKNGITVGTRCWDCFGKRASLSEEDKAAVEAAGLEAAEVSCTFCQADMALSDREKRVVELDVDGTLWETHWIPVGHDAYLHFAVDITDRSDGELTNGRAFLFEKTQSLARLGYWAQDLNSGKLSWSDNTFEIFGIQWQALDYAGFLKLVAPEDRDRVQEATRSVTEDGFPSYDIEYALIRPDGTRVNVHEEAFLQKDTFGSPARLLGIIQDISD